MLGDASLVLGTLVGRPGSSTVACLGGAQIDRFGNVNSTEIPGGPFLVGSGGGNDVASVCEEAVVVATLTPQRTPPECGYITSPGRAVQALVTDLGTFEKPAPLDRSTFVLTALAPGVDVDDVRAACGWDVEAVDELSVLPAPTPEEIGALRTWDPRGWFLRA
jgi:acyl CoA:acetate/3-ketoacid CoA transferase beta subunit